MGLIKTAAKVAVASSVHGRVQRRQQRRWAAQEGDAVADGPTAPFAPLPPPTEATRPAAPTTADTLAKLKTLGELRDSGVLTDAEFEQQKAIILAG